MVVSITVADVDNVPSVAVTVTVYVCATDEKRCVTLVPVPVVPSPKFHEYVKGFELEAAALSDTNCPINAGLGLAVGWDEKTGAVAAHMGRANIANSAKQNRVT